MKKLARILALVSLGLTSLQRFHTKPVVGPIRAILLSPLKLLAGALATLTAAQGTPGTNR